MNVKEIMNKIEKLQFNKESFMEYIFQNSEPGTEHHFIQNMLIQLVDFGLYESISSSYYHFVEVCTGEKARNHNECTKDETKFSEGDTTNLKQEIEKLSNIYKEFTKISDYEIYIIIDHFRATGTRKTSVQYLKMKEEKLKENNQKLEELKKQNIFKRISNHKQKKLLTKENQKLKEDIAIYKKDIMQIKEKDESIIEMLKQKDISHFTELFQKFIDNPQYNGIFTNHLVSFIENIKDYEHFENEIFSYWELIKNMRFLVKEGLEKEKSLEEVCHFIRHFLIKYSARKVGIDEEKLMSGKRKVNLKSSEFTVEMNDGFDFFDYTTPPEKIEEDIAKLSTTYKNIMNEEDNETFIKKCIDFHFDFLKVHPYNNGNGRTGRILLTAMLASHNIYFPSLYSNTFEKYIFQVKSNSALKGDYKPLEDYIFKRLNAFYSSIDQELAKESQSTINYTEEIEPNISTEPHKKR